MGRNTRAGKRTTRGFGRQVALKDFSGVRIALGRSLAARVCSRVAKARNVNAGFTLIELMVVLSVIVILASMGLAQYRNSVVYASEAVLRQDLTLMRDAIDQYYADKGQYPGSLDALVSDGYLRKIPDDPFTKSTSSWQTVPSEPDLNNPTAEPGVFDVKSGSDRTALDGSKYAEW
jgi:general secretion pathway protein G